MKLVWPGGSLESPKSDCSRPCKSGYAKKLMQGDSCCWMCIECKENQSLIDEFTCHTCAEGWWPNLEKNKCLQLPELYMKIISIYASMSIGLASIGVILTLGIIIIFIIYNDTPIVRASGRELTYLVLTGILLSYLMTFIIVAKPTKITCAIQRIGIGFAFVIVYAALLTKTNRIARIFQSATKSAKRPPFISPKSQIIITVLLISIQVLFSLAWVIYDPPTTKYDYPNGRKNERVLKCKTDIGSFFISLIYIIILISTCTFYAFKTRKIPENFNESKFIAFTMYTVCKLSLY